MSGRLLHALKNVVTFCAFGATLVALVLARAASSPVAVVATLVVSLGLLLLLERRRRLVAIWAGYVAAFVTFAELRAVADETGIPVQYDYVVDADRALFGGTLPTVWLQEHLADTPVVEPLLGWSLLIVYGSYYVAPHAVALVLARRGSALFRRYALALLGIAYTGLLVSVFVPTAPPWLAGAEGRTEPVARIVPELTGQAEAGLYERGSELVGLNPVAAFPSLHTALTVLLVLVAASGGLRKLAAAYTVAMGFALVYLGEHYVIDVAAGAALAVAVWALVRAVEQRRGLAPERGLAAPAGVATAPVRPT